LPIIPRFRDVETVEVWRDDTVELSLLFDPEMNLDERILKEQFVP
jgi:NAD+ kinase